MIFGWFKKKEEKVPPGPCSVCTYVVDPGRFAKCSKFGADPTDGTYPYTSITRGFDWERCSDGKHFDLDVTKATDYID